MGRQSRVPSHYNINIIQDVLGKKRYTERQEDKIITLALSPRDNYSELKLAKFLQDKQD